MWVTEAQFLATVARKAPSSELACVIRDRLNRYRFGHISEAELQRAVSIVLEGMALEVPVVREARLSPKDRVDFIVGRLGVEVKCGGSLSELRGQIFRYLGYDRLEALLVITDKLRLANLPAFLHDKPITVCCLGARL